MRSELLAPGVGIFGHNEARGPLSTIVHARTWRNTPLMDLGSRCVDQLDMTSDSLSYGIHVHPIAQLIPPSTGII